MTRSASGEYTFSPPVMIMSLRRSEMNRNPPSSTCPMSPLRSQPPAVTACAVSCGRFRYPIMRWPERNQNSPGCPGTTSPPVSGSTTRSSTPVTRVPA